MTGFHLGTRRFVVELNRRGSRSIFTATVTTQTEATGPVERAQLFILENPRGDLSLARLANLVGLSPRQLSRLFRAQLNMSPTSYVELTRIDTARRLLEHSALPIKAIAYRAGFGSTATLRRAFRRQTGISPLEFRRQSPIIDTDDGDAC